MATKLSHTRMFFTVPASDELDEKYVLFKQALRDIDEFVELDSDEDDEGKDIYIIVIEGDVANAPALIKRIDRIVDKLTK